MEFIVTSPAGGVSFVPANADSAPVFFRLIAEYTRLTVDGTVLKLICRKTVSESSIPANFIVHK